MPHKTLLLLALESLTIRICQCASAATQLIQRGLFPCSPLAPTLAVDLQVLDFATRLFVHIPPNNTAWCRTVEEFLDAQGYKLVTQVIYLLSLLTFTNIFSRIHFVEGSRTPYNGTMLFRMLRRHT